MYVYASDSFFSSFIISGFMYKIKRKEKKEHRENKRISQQFKNNNS